MSRAIALLIVVVVVAFVVWYFFYRSARDSSGVRLSGDSAKSYRTLSNRWLRKRAFEHSGFYSESEKQRKDENGQRYTEVKRRFPKLREFAVTPGAIKLRVRLPKGKLTWDDIQAGSEALASNVPGALEVKVERLSANEVLLVFVRDDAEHVVESPLPAADDLDDLFAPAIEHGGRSG